MKSNKERIKRSDLRIQIDALLLCKGGLKVLKCNTKDYRDFDFGISLTKLVGDDLVLTNDILNSFGDSTDITEVKGYVYLVYDRRKYITIDAQGKKFIPYDLMIKIKAFLESKQLKLN